MDWSAVAVAAVTATAASFVGDLLAFLAALAVACSMAALIASTLLKGSFWLILTCFLDWVLLT
jgi:hypothetical protein